MLTSSSNWSVAPTEVQEITLVVGYNFEAPDFGQFVGTTVDSLIATLVAGEDSSLEGSNPFLDSSFFSLIIQLRLLNQGF